MTGIWNPEFRDENRSSRYPFSDDSALVSDDGLALDPGMLLDASIYPIGVGPRCALTAIDVAQRLVTFWVGDSAEPRRASGSFDPFLPPDGIYLEDPRGRPAGMLLAERTPLAASQAWAAGMHTFAAGSAEFVASCVIPTPEPGLRSLLTGAGDLLAGDIWIVGERGVVVRDDGGAIRVDVVGDPLFSRRLCFPLQLFSTPRFIRTINGVPPGPDGSFRIVVDDRSTPDTVLRIYPLADDQLGIGLVGRAVEG
jgi:hypothetical protein